MTASAPPTAGVVRIPAPLGSRRKAEDPSGITIAAAGWYSVERVAKLLGYSHVTIWRKIKAGDIPHRRNGAQGTYRIPKWWVDQELESVRSQVIRRPPPDR